MKTFPPLVLAALLVGLLGLSACSPAPGSSLFANTAATADVAAAPPQIEVLRGDVLVVDGRHLRLVDVTAPRSSPDAHCVAEAVASRQAQLRLEALARHVRTVVVTPSGGIDDHDRTFAHVQFDGVDPARVLIDEGLAVAPQPRGFDWCSPVDTTHPAARRIAMLSFSGP